ncbi:MAG: phosphoribosylformylglycinamidine synthase subunit PurL, partial [Thaumarchaeota archaeon]|nr:phosphoribosylformylglycinamidine synthase subunit PurL [Nitrososphaerota archaeon]
MSLETQELTHLKSKICRNPTQTEIQIVAAEWSEHCSYKSSKKHLKMLPMSGPLVISEKGYDSGVLDVGDGYVVTVHIESHNHPSAVEPYGGAATGVGGVIRDILSTGTRPIAILDGLRFGNIEKDSQARWLFKNAVIGIADYGNCLGIPTIGGEVEFDDCYTNYALVDVAAIGFGKKDRLIKNHAKKGDLVVLLGGSTGRDGIGGSQFASDLLESENRSAVQIPDPFIEKLIIETILEARNHKLIKAMKDLGGGGLSCAISEIADSLSVGIELDVNKVHTREPNMNTDEIMVSESQERMLIITDKKKLKKFEEICKKFRIKCSVLGKVTQKKMMKVTRGKKTFANLPTNVVVNAPLLDRPASKPKYLKSIRNEKKFKIINLSTILLKLLSSPNIASKNWVYD